MTAPQSGATVSGESDYLPGLFRPLGGDAAARRPYHDAGGRYSPLPILRIPVCSILPERRVCGRS